MRSLVRDIESGIVRFRLYDDGILWMTFSEDTEIDETETRRQHELTKEITAGKTCGLLIDTRGRYISATREAQALSAEFSKSGTRCADAILVDGAASAILGNFYIRFSRPSIPTKMFTSEEKALQWLASQIEKVSGDSAHKKTASVS